MNVQCLVHWAQALLIVFVGANVGTASSSSSVSDCPCADGHGICIPGHSGCFCEEGWAGATCANATCFPRCSSHGKCVDDPNAPAGVPGKMCECDRGWDGVSCEESVCPNDCYEREGRGLCVEVGKDNRTGAVMKECYCHPHFTSVDCGSKRCMVEGGCGEHGTCVASVDGGDFLDKCACDRGWNGTRCQTQTCVHDCLNGGVCGADLRCECHLGYTGERCGRMVTEIPEGEGATGSATGGEEDTGTGKPTLPALPEPEVSGPKPGDCQHGEWKLDEKNMSAICDCDSGWDGMHCNEITCPGEDGPCNGNGMCDLMTKPESPTCKCNVGWFGEDCSKLPCPNNCGKDEEGDPHGDCINDVCQCTVEWEGVDCMAPTHIRTDLPCSQDCPADCEHAADCEQYELRYWVPIWHSKMLTTDRLYSWVTPGTGKPFQYELNEAHSLGRGVPMDDQKYGEQARQCYLGCVERCVSKCFNALHSMTDSERTLLMKTQKLAKRLPGITGNKMEDIDAEIRRDASGLPPAHFDYTASQIITYLEKLTKATEGGVKDQLPKEDNPVAVNSQGGADFVRDGAAATGPEAESKNGSVALPSAATMQEATSVD